MSSAKDEVQRSLGRIEGQLDGIAKMLKQHFEDDRRNFEAVDKRMGELGRSLGNVKKKIWFGSGFSAALGSGLTLLLSLARAH